MGGAARIGADIIAAVDVPFEAPTGASPGPAQFDVALVNATTGLRSSLPTGANTTAADELHPSLTPDGRWLAFERVDPVAGTTRIIAVNLTTGQTADLFNTFDISRTQAATPFMEPDGSTVVTGTAYAFNPQRTSTSLGAVSCGAVHARPKSVLDHRGRRTDARSRRRGVDLGSYGGRLRNR